MTTYGITEHIDLALVALYAFWLFFAGLIYYLHSENKREGYPLINDRSDKVRVEGFPPVPKPKKFVLAHAGTEEVTREERDLTGLLVPSASFQGAPLVPTGDAMKDGVGPASWSERADVPDLTYDDQIPKIVPLRVANGYYLAEEDPDPRGMEVVCTDGNVAGVVVDAWVDRSETLVRYLEADVPAPGGTRRVVFPMALAVVDGKRGVVRVDSVTAEQFRAAPAIRDADQITLREEDIVSGYFAGGHMYAIAGRMGPVL
jgi:photosynthetic reaction center H subunit